MRRHYYDPLYHAVVFESFGAYHGQRAFFRYGSSLSQPRDTTFPDVPSEILGTFEVTRLNHLRQAGLAYLVFPSATHTRFAHALGTTHVGCEALSSIIVRDHASGSLGAEDFRTSLEQFVRDEHLQEEFLLALMLHDLGHLPFSHTLENNETLQRCLAHTGGPTEHLRHEEIACQLIMGSGRAWEAARRAADAQADATGLSIRLVSEALAAADSSLIQREVICYLISGEESFLGSVPGTRRPRLRLLHELVSGLLDIDRIDHYRRDSYFTGLPYATFRPNGLLKGMEMRLSGEGAGRVVMRLSHEAIREAVSLLLSKRRLTSDCFEAVENIAYNAMLNRAATLFLQDGDPHLSWDLLFWTDDELVARFGSCKVPAVKALTHRIRSARPYPVAWHGTVARGEYLQPGALARLAGEAARAFDLPDSSVLAAAAKHFGRSGHDEWLDLSRIEDEEGLLLGTDERYRRLVAPVRDEAAIEGRAWFFVEREEMVSTVRPWLEARLR